MTFKEIKKRQQSIYVKKYKVYNTSCPANSYNANLGRTRLQIKASLSQSGTDHKKSDGGGCEKRVAEAWLARIFSCLYENFISIIIILSATLSRILWRKFASYLFAFKLIQHDAPFQVIKIHNLSSKCPFTIKVYLWYRISLKLTFIGIKIERAVQSE